MKQNILRSGLNIIAFGVGLTIALFLIVPYVHADTFNAKEVREEYCKELWGRNYELRNQCLINQEYAHNRYYSLISGLKPALDADEEGYKIVEQAYELFYPDFELILKETIKQLRAYVEYLEAHREK